MTRARAGDSRLANAMMAEYYAQRACVGLVIAEATTVSAQGNGWVGSPGVYTDEMGAAWKPVVDAVHSAPGGSTPFFLQLWHCGRASHSVFHNGQPAISASAIKLQGESIDTPDGFSRIPLGLERKSSVGRHRLELRRRRYGHTALGRKLLARCHEAIEHYYKRRN